VLVLYRVRGGTRVTLSNTAGAVFADVFVRRESEVLWAPRPCA
jgi:hypothetical protein